MTIDKISITLTLLIFTYPCMVKSVPEGSCQDNIIGHLLTYTVKGDETLYDIARAFDIGIDELIYANKGIDPWLPGVGALLTIPSFHALPPRPYKGIVINKAEVRLYYFLRENDITKVLTFPISIGVMGHDTPIGTAKIRHKQKNPYWIPPLSMRRENSKLPPIVAPGPDNPLGEFALYLEWNQILIHGTNKPWSIGTYGSHGCIRLYPEDIKKLFPLVEKGTLVRVIDEPIKVGWLNHALYLEASFFQKDVLDSDDFARIMTLLKGLPKDCQVSINWDAVNAILKNPTGVPAKISQ